MNETNKILKRIVLQGKVSVKDDPLLFLLDSVHFKTKDKVIYINIIKSLMVLYLQIFNVLGIAFICKDETTTYLRKYLSVILGQQIGITFLTVTIYFTPAVLNLPETLKIHLLPLNFAGRKAHKKIIGQCAMVKKLYPFIYILLMVMHATMLPIVGDEEDIEFTVMFISRYFTVWPNFFKGLYYVCLISLGYGIASACCICLYAMIHIKFRFHLLAEYLKHISNGFEPSNEDIMCQDVISRRLKSFVDAHNGIKTIWAAITISGKWILIVSAIPCSVLYAGLGYFLVAGVSLSSNFRIILIIITAAIITYIFTRSGQEVQDESLNLYNSAYQCQWIYWNVQNRKTLLMIIINTSKITKLTCFGIMDLGYVITLRMLKVAYSTVLLFVNLY